MDALKRCSACGCEKPLTEFHRDARQPGGLMYQCKSCRKILRRMSYEKNKPKQLAYQKSQRAAIMADPIAAREFRWIKNFKRKIGRENKSDAADHS